MKKYESEKTEFKVIFNDRAVNTVIAFANADGGELYIGVDDDGNEVGLKNVDEEYTRITNTIRGSIEPDVAGFVKYELTERRVVKVSVGEGPYKPYFLKSKGISPSGVYIRQGATSLRASWEQISEMVRSSGSGAFDNTRSMNQELTFTAAAHEFREHCTAFDEGRYIQYGIRNISDGLYTNTALIISDQCPYTIKAVVYSGVGKDKITDRSEFCGSVFSQLRDALDYVGACRKLAGEAPDYPFSAVREALLNAIVHRDYGFSGSTIISLFDDRIEITSLGGLQYGLSEPDIRAGISQPRNRTLAAIFSRLGLSESFGSGIGRIFGAYSQLHLQPEIRITGSTFTMILPSLSAKGA